MRLIYISEIKWRRIETYSRIIEKNRVLICRLKFYMLKQANTTNAQTGKYH